MKEIATGQWTTILTRLGVEPLLLDGKHHPSPTCGGKDGFRFINKEGDGYFVNNNEFGDGFALLKLLYGWSFKESCEKVREALGVNVQSRREQVEVRARRVEAEAKRKKALLQQYRRAAKRAEAIWQEAAQVTNHEYLDRKGVKSYGLRASKGALIIPVRKMGRIMSIQYVTSKGKFFMEKGNVVAGYFLIKGTGEMVICEGYATGASIREATGLNVAIAFNASNIIQVARFMHSKKPAMKIIIAADNDLKLIKSGKRKGEQGKNAGLEAAVKAAQETGALIALPEGLKGRSVDWNDIHVEFGLNAVADGIANARSAEGTMIAIAAGIE